MERKVPTFVRELCLTKADKESLDELGIHMESKESAYVVFPGGTAGKIGISIDLSNCEDVFQVANQVLVAVRNAFWAVQIPRASVNLPEISDFLRPIEVYSDLGELRRGNGQRGIKREFDQKGNLTRLYLEDK